MDAVLVLYLEDLASQDLDPSLGQVDHPPVFSQYHLPSFQNLVHEIFHSPIFEDVFLEFFGPHSVRRMELICRGKLLIV